MVRDAEKKLGAAKMKHGLAYRRLHAESHSFDTQISKHEQSLRESYDPAIDKFLKKINTFFEHFRNDVRPEILKQELVIDGASGMQRWNQTYDTERWQDTRKKIGEIYEQADAMKLEAVEDVPANLKELRKGIPKNSYTSGFDYR